MLRLVKGMVAETNDVWYWNHPNIDYWVSQQSLVYIKHSPVTGWPAGVILIIRQRNMAPLGTAGPWNTASSMLSSSSSPGVLAHALIPNESTFLRFFAKLHGWSMNAGSFQGLNQARLKCKYWLIQLYPVDKSCSDVYQKKAEGNPPHSCQNYWCCEVTAQLL